LSHLAVLDKLVCSACSNTRFSIREVCSKNCDISKKR